MFDQNQPFMYFLATGNNWDQLAAVNNTMPLNALLAVNDMEADYGIERGVNVASDLKLPVMVDSGVFNLSMMHARRHDLHMDEALQVPPDSIDGFDNLWKAYARVADAFKPYMWGMVEIDQGGEHNKRITRQRIENEIGIIPIPVYHPLVDSREYLDELCEQYDRICVGNVVQAPPNVRKRLMATVWSRLQQYPHVWAHLLGVTPGPWTASFPFHSCDSSTAVASLRWPHVFVASANGGPQWELPASFLYKRTVPSDDPGGYKDGVRLCSSLQRDWMKQWRQHMDDLQATVGPVLGRSNDDN